MSYLRVNQLNYCIYLLIAEDAVNKRKKQQHRFVFVFVNNDNILIGYGQKWNDDWFDKMPKIK